MANTTGKKYGGRQKGTPNKVTGDVRQWLSELIDSNRSQIEKDIKKLDPKDRLQILEKFMQYTIPKMQSISANIDLNELTDQKLNTIINEIIKDID